MARPLGNCLALGIQHSSCTRRVSFRIKVKRELVPNDEDFGSEGDTPWPESTVEVFLVGENPQAKLKLVEIPVHTEQAELDARKTAVDSEEATLATEPAVLTTERAAFDAELTPNELGIGHRAIYLELSQYVRSHICLTLQQLRMRCGILHSSSGPRKVKPALEALTDLSTLIANSGMGGGIRGLKSLGQAILAWSAPQPSVMLNIRSDERLGPKPDPIQAEVDSTLPTQPTTDTLLPGVQGHGAPTLGE
ncbi:Uu.00g111880.m01.CDS01 [Anthostomella pinea]|uniref:Uu.00g111880.m01.CDS01 n=1 Tax=Anthostomella pinea TaxID=933095 RepID=A0AAI8YGB2_9PEZI|nr:Uu.00g111880.m01.CDS01 [Anthostomella pinea]